MGVPVMEEDIKVSKFLHELKESGNTEAEKQFWDAVTVADEIKERGEDDESDVTDKESQIAQQILKALEEGDLDRATEIAEAAKPKLETGQFFQYDHKLLGAALVLGGLAVGGFALLCWLEHNKKN